MSNIIDFEEAKKKLEEKKQEVSNDQEILVLNALNYNKDNKDEEMFCTGVEEAGRLFANEVAKGTVPETETEEDVKDTIESFKNNLPLPDTDRKKLCVNRVNADINDAEIKRDSYLETTQSTAQSSKSYVYSNGHSMLEDDKGLSKAS